MICELTEHMDIREMAQLDPNLPSVIDVKGERIVIERTKTAFGGTRPWFLCPSCDRRCAIIYRLGNSHMWWCRVCGDGRYQCELKSPQDRLLHQALKVRKSLGQTKNGIGVPFPARPKNMHKKTYAKIVTKAVERERKIFGNLTKWLPKM